MPGPTSAATVDSASLTKILRLLSLLLVGLSFVIIHFFNVGQIGDSMQWKDGNSTVSAGSHPLVILWTAIAIALFVAVMRREPSIAVFGIPSRGRRILAFVIDFWFSLLTLSSVGALIPLWLEATRTGHFVWAVSTQLRRQHGRSFRCIVATLHGLNYSLLCISPNQRKTDCRVFHNAA